MKNIMKLLAIVGIVVGISSQAEGHKMVCSTGTFYDTALKGQYDVSYTPGDRPDMKCYLIFDSSLISNSSTPASVPYKTFSYKTSRLIYFNDNGDMLKFLYPDPTNTYGYNIYLPSSTHQTIEALRGRFTDLF